MKRKGADNYWPRPLFLFIFLAAHLCREEFIAVPMTVNQLGQIVCGPFELMAQSCDGRIIKQTVNLFPKSLIEGSSPTSS